MLGLKLNHVSKSGPWWRIRVLVNQDIIGSYNGLPLARHQAIIWTSALRGMNKISANLESKYKKLIQDTSYENVVSEMVFIFFPIAICVFLLTLYGLVTPYGDIELGPVTLNWGQFLNRYLAINH